MFGFWRRYGEGDLGGVEGRWDESERRGQRRGGEARHGDGLRESGRKRGLDRFRVFDHEVIALYKAVSNHSWHTQGENDPDRR